MNTPSHHPFLAMQEAERGLLSLKKLGLNRKHKIAQSACDTKQIFNGQQYKTFCSNDYLGLANHPEVIQASRDALSKYGVGSGASHLISGHQESHERLANRLSDFQRAHIPDVHTLTFSTGYMANVGVITALCHLSNSTQLAPKELTSIYSARLNHASIIDGIRLASKESTVKLTIFEVEELQALEDALQRDANKHKLIICDGVFSMDGNLSPVHKLLDLAARYDTLLLIDDAHGFGVLGEKGHGILEHMDLCSERLVYIGTLGKAAGVMGAFVCAHQTLIDWVFQKSRPYIYTTASPPALAMAALKSLDLIEGPEGQHKRAHLRQLILYWQTHLHLQQWHSLQSLTPIQPLIVGQTQLCLLIDQELQALGVFIPAIRPPTVPNHSARLRVTFSALHAQQDIQALIQVLMNLESKFLPT